MYSARNVWHAFRPTTSRTHQQANCMLSRHVVALKFSTSLRPTPSGALLHYPRPPSRLLDSPLHRRFQQSYYSSKPPQRNDTPNSSEQKRDSDPSPPKSNSILTKPFRENIYTFPNLLTVSRIAACPVLGWAILSDNYVLATGLLAYAGVTDWVRRFINCRRRSLLIERRMDVDSGRRLPRTSI